MQLEVGGGVVGQGGIRPMSWECEAVNREQRYARQQLPESSKSIPAVTGQSKDFR
jgi:hypothetical protein